MLVSCDSYVYYHNVLNSHFICSCQACLAFSNWSGRDGEQGESGTVKDGNERRDEEWKEQAFRRSQVSTCVQLHPAKCFRKDLSTSECQCVYGGVETLLANRLSTLKFADMYTLWKANSGCGVINDSRSFPKSKSTFHFTLLLLKVSPLLLLAKALLNRYNV